MTEASLEGIEMNLCAIITRLGEICSHLGESGIGEDFWMPLSAFARSRFLCGHHRSRNDRATFLQERERGIQIVNTLAHHLAKSQQAAWNRERVEQLAQAILQAQQPPGEAKE